MNIHGIPKPTYCAFELLHELGTERFAVDGLHHTVDAWVVKKDDSASVLLTNHALPKHPIKTETVKVVLENVPDYSSAFVKRVDENHANSKKLWISMGKPEYLSAAQVEQLNEASRLIKEPLKCDYKNSRVEFEIEMPPHSVASVTVDFS